jgi:DNA-binding MarR family transcriptional regulator
MGVDPSILVTLLNPLEEDGLLTRRRDPADRRRHIVAITPKGETTLRGAERAHDAAEEELLSALDADQRAQLQELLLELERGLAVPDDACEEDESTAEC